MNTSLTSAAILAGALILTPNIPTAFAAPVQVREAGARSDQQTERTEQDKIAQRFVKLEQIKGATVKLHANPEAIRKAAKDGETADRPECTVNDLMLDPRTGQITRALIGAGGFLGIGEKTVAIDFGELTWDQEDACFSLSMTRKDLENAESFDLSEAKKRDRKAHAVEASSSKASQPQQLGDYFYQPYQGGFFVGGELDELELYDAIGQEFGGVSDTIIDLDERKVAYFVISRGGVAGVGADRYLMPMANLTLTQRMESDEDEANSVLWTKRTTADLELAPAYDEPDQGVITKAMIDSVKTRFKG
ncbi:PRC-barrel domain-containing protein [Engelhardtia mirabilis]|uniref:PRC-barrel domain protein n=1 Tax=Engelhardtia mirabilis TaxID=2528011 RepID=A0A518BQZ2_9BACT|nr:PRC-barrel domain protein [Planctomycetes bacterium Pla133]QDV03711.1 PRC-barrel domain protein [Planctomycetes bacterium Pla86]